MAASTQARPDLQTNPTVSMDYPVATNTQIWQYEHCCVNAAGYLVPASDTAGLLYVGQARMSVNNTGANGAVSCPVESIHVNPYATFNAVTPLPAWVGQHLFFTDDNTVALTGSTSHTVCAGRCETILITGATGSVRVDRTDRFAPTTAA